MILFLRHRVKLIAFILVFALAGTIYAANYNNYGYRVRGANTTVAITGPNGNTVGTVTPNIEEHDQCRVAVNKTGKGDVFIPTKSALEWQKLWTSDQAIRPASLPAGLSFQNCGACSKDAYGYGSSGGGDPENPQASATGEAVNALRADINSQNMDAAYKQEILSKTSQIDWPSGRLNAGDNPQTKSIPTSKGNITSIATIENYPQSGGSTYVGGYDVSIEWIYPPNICNQMSLPGPYTYGYLHSASNGSSDIVNCVLNGCNNTPLGSNIIGIKQKVSEYSGWDAATKNNATLIANSLSGANFPPGCSTETDLSCPDNNVRTTTMWVKNNTVYTTAPAAPFQRFIIYTNQTRTAEGSPDGYQTTAEITITGPYSD